MEQGELRPENNLLYFPSMHPIEDISNVYLFLEDFACNQIKNKRFYSAFYSAVVFFENKKIASEDDFENFLWEVLKELNSIDSQKYQWASGYSRNTRDDNFAFSIAEEAFFIVGLHPFAHRLSRNFKCPALVFNHHEIFSALRLSGHFDKYKAVIRKNEMHIQGSVNRQLSDFGKNQKLRNMPVLTKIFLSKIWFSKRR
ncbi:YqcI/YcgG family protein [Edwardsiella ictaluri]